MQADCAGGLELLSDALEGFAANRDPWTAVGGHNNIAKLIEDYLSWEIVINTPQAIIAALAIEARYKISYWDALILHAAESCGAAVLYSEDLSHGQRYGAVAVVNPLRS